MRKRLTGLIFFLSLTSALVGRQALSDSLLTVFIAECNQKITYWWQAGNFDSAWYYCDRLQSVSEEHKDGHNVIWALGWKIFLTNEFNQYDEMLAALNENEQALAQYKNYLLAEKKDTTRYQESYSSHLSNRAIYYYLIGDYQQAQKHLEKAVNWLEPLNNPISHFFLPILYRYQASIYKRQGNYQEALNYFQALQVLNQEGKANLGGLDHKHIGDIYRLKDEFEEAHKHYHKAYQANLKDFQDNPKGLGLRKRLITTFLTWAANFEERGQYDSSKVLLEQCGQYMLENDPFWPLCHFQFGQTYSSMKNWQAAEEAYFKAIEWEQATGGEHTAEMAQFYAAVGNLNLQTKKYDQALQYFQKALISLSGEHQALMANNNPSLAGIYARRLLLNVLKGKTQSLQMLAQTQDNHYLQLGWETALLGVDLVDSIKSGYGAGMDKQFLVKESYPLFEMGLDLALSIYQIRQEPQYLSQAFNLAEKSKAVILHEALKGEKARKFAGIPEAVLEEERALRANLTLWEDSLANGLVHDTTVHIRYHDIRDQYAQFQQKLETDYPAYYRLKYRNHLNSLEAARKLLPDAASSILEYFVGDQNIFVFQIDSDEIQLHKISKDFPLEDWVQHLRSGLYNYHTATDAKRTETLFDQCAQKYSQYGYQLFDRILKPVLPTQKEINRLMIIPDGVLGYIPFGALLQSPVADPGLFDQHPYVILNYDIGYGSSVSLLTEMQEQLHRQSNPGLLAFAPVFENHSADQSPTFRGNNLALPYSREELIQLARLIGADTFMTHRATKARFLELAPQYQMIHLATHGWVNDLDPDASYLSFYPSDSLNQGDQLRVEELYELSLPAELVVLSACETGLGKLYRGEGIMSLARGFSYAGVKSLITTLWSISDAPVGAGIMPDFYQGLEKGMRKDEALRQAKINHIRQAFIPVHAHPYYWAAYNAVGNMSPLSGSGLGIWWWILGLGLVGLGLGFWRFKIKIS